MELAGGILGIGGGPEGLGKPERLTVDASPSHSREGDASCNVFAFYIPLISATACSVVQTALAMNRKFAVAAS